MNQGSPPGQWGDYEWLRLLHWSTLVAALGVAALTWGCAELLPAMTAHGGYWAAAAVVLTPLANALRLHLADNTNKSV